MRTTRMMNVHGTPVAVKNAAGEWVEIGYITNLDFTVEVDEWMPWERPFKTFKDYTFSLDARATNTAIGTLLGLEHGDER